MNRACMGRALHATTHKGRPVRSVYEGLSVACYHLRCAAKRARSELARILRA